MQVTDVHLVILAVHFVQVELLHFDAETVVNGDVHVLGAYHRFQAGFYKTVGWVREKDIINDFWEIDFLHLRIGDAAVFVHHFQAVVVVAGQWLQVKIVVLLLALAALRALLSNLLKVVAIGGALQDVAIHMVAAIVRPEKGREILLFLSTELEGLALVALQCAAHGDRLVHLANELVVGTEELHFHVVRASWHGISGSR